MKIKHIIESMGGTTAGAIASVASPMGETQKRNKPEKAPKVTKGKKYANVISEGKMKDLAYDIQNLDAGNFMKKYGQPKEYYTKKLGNPPPQTKPVSEAELQEDDLILVPGQIRKKDKSFTPHDKDRRDHEVEMARKELYAAAKDAMRIFKQIKHRSEDEGLMAWQQSYITLASDYLNSVADSLAEPASANEMTGGVIAGGQVQEISDFKKKEIEYELRNEPKNNYQVSIDGRAWKVFADKAHAEAVARKLRAKGKKAEVHVTGASVTASESKLDEKKDACYSKVKSRYKVWPSAYASGALSKCRKVGASNWGNKSKK